MKLMMIVVVALALLAITVDAGASDKIAQLKARVSAAPAAQALPAAPKAPCAAAPTFKLPVKLVGVADQMPGDKEHNEILIAKADPDIAINKAKSIKEIDLRESAAAVQRATNAQDNFHQMQAVVLKEPLLPRQPL